MAESKYSIKNSENVSNKWIEIWCTLKFPKRNNFVLFLVLASINWMSFSCPNPITKTLLKKNFSKFQNQNNDKLQGEWYAVKYLVPGIRFSILWPWTESIDLGVPVWAQPGFSVYYKIRIHSHDWLQSLGHVSCNSVKKTLSLLHVMPRTRLSDRIANCDQTFLRKKHLIRFIRSHVWSHRMSFRYIQLFHWHVISTRDPICTFSIRVLICTFN